MGKEEIVERILKDAEGEYSAILADAEAQAKNIIDEATARAEKQRQETEEEVSERTRRISEGRSAAARLDSQKILLGEKRRVLDVIYALSLNALEKAGEKESLALFTHLIDECAEKGDEIVFAENFAYAEKAAALPLIKERGLTVSKERAKLSGGVILRGKACDKDLSYSSLLKADADEHQAALAGRLFGLGKNA